MAERILLGTRKGTLFLTRGRHGWEAGPIRHPGIPACYAAADPRDGTLWASLDHGHWGPKLSRSRDGGQTWESAPPIKYPEGARFIEQVLPTPDADGGPGEGRVSYKDAKVLKIWCLAFGGPDEPGTLYAGTIPGGLCVSRDGGESWELNRPLWPRRHATRRAYCRRIRGSIQA